MFTANDKRAWPSMATCKAVRPVVRYQNYWVAVKKNEIMGVNLGTTGFLGVHGDA